MYHYTTVDAMMKIVNSRKLWTTSITYLNDTLEGEHFLRMVRQRLPALRAKYELGQIALGEFGAAERLIEHRPFITSFSADGDSLPQWRSYCPSGNGVAVGFRVGCLKRARLSTSDDTQTNLTEYVQRAEFRPVEYMVDETPSLFLDSCIATLVKDADELFMVAQNAWGGNNKLTREAIFIMFSE